MAPSNFSNAGTKKKVREYNKLSRILLDLQLPLQSVPITTNVVSSNAIPITTNIITNNYTPLSKLSGGRQCNKMPINVIISSIVGAKEN
jgi:hypothetical protein